MQSINSHANSTHRRSAGTEHRRRAFTLIELLVTIGIIVILIGILIPVVSKIRQSANGASTQAMLSSLSMSINAYMQANGGALPGPIGNDDVYSPNFTTANNPNIAPVMIATAPTGFDNTNFDPTKISMSQNLVLGLLGGLYVDTSTAGNPITYDPSRVGQGPMGLNRTNPAINRRAEPYFAPASSDLSWQGSPKVGHYHDDSSAAGDTNIPVFLDKYPNQMPILYLRAKAGAAPQLGAPFPTSYGHDYNPVITDDIKETATYRRAGQYDLSQIIAYTGAFDSTGAISPTATNQVAPPAAGSTSIGVGKKISVRDYVNYGTTVNALPFHGLRTVDLTTSTNSSATGYTYPYDAYSYFQDPNAVPASATAAPGGRARMKDQFILISAGPDRVYGTKDDIVNFGDINP